MSAGTKEGLKAGGPYVLSVVVVFAMWFNAGEMRAVRDAVQSIKTPKHVKGNPFPVTIDSSYHTTGEAHRVRLESNMASDGDFTDMLTQHEARLRAIMETLPSSEKVNK